MIFFESLFSSLVYFPIALLLIYSICEIIWSHRLAINPSWVFMKACLLLFGTSTYYLVSVNGGLPTNIDTANPENIQTIIFVQELFRMIRILFSILSACYILKLFRVSWPHFFGNIMQGDKGISLIVRLLTRTQRVLIDSPFVHVLGVLGFAMIVVAIFIG